MVHMQRKNILFIIAIGIVTYGLLITRLGFYWDDWPFAWIIQFMGPAEFFPAFAPFRPFLAPIFYLTTSTLGTNPLNWQIFALVLRILISIASYWSLSLIFPQQKFSTLIASLLLLVFPGYSQHFVALTHINQELIPLFFYILSFGFTALALREQKIIYLYLALLFQFLGIFPTEYFFTTEPLRFFFIFCILAFSSIASQANSATLYLRQIWLRAGEAFQKWTPYLFVWLLNAAWLFYYYRFGAYRSYNIKVGEDEARTSLSLLDFFDTLYKLCAVIWVQILSFISQSITAPSTLAIIGLMIIVFIFTIFFLIKSKQSNNSNSPILLIVIGVAGMIFGRVPSWAAGLPLVLQSINDRFMVSMMLGSVLFIIGVLELIKHERVKLVASALLISMGVGQQLYNANIFRWDWEKQREFYWQLAWRIPDLQEGTLILTHQLPFEYETDFSTTAALNWMYAPDYKAGDNLPYALVYTRSRLGGSKLPALEPNIHTRFEFRTVTFNGNTSNSITVFMPSSGCLRVLDPIYANTKVYDRYPKFLRSSIPFSNPSLINTDAPDLSLPIKIFGAEPEKNWCYYYEKAELARQKGDWEKVKDIGDQTLSDLMTAGAQDGYELLPFIEAYALTENFERSRELSLIAIKSDIKPIIGVCQAWERTQAQSSDGSESELFSKKMLVELGCPPQ